jgi:hypothetical protein
LKSVPRSGENNLPAEKVYHRQLLLIQYYYQPMKTIFNLNFLNGIYQGSCKYYLMESNVKIKFIPSLNIHVYLQFIQDNSYYKVRNRDGDKLISKHFILTKSFTIT